MNRTSKISRSAGPELSEALEGLEGIRVERDAPLATRTSMGVGGPARWFIEVDRPERLVFTWQPPAAVFPDGAYETTVALSFEDLDGATRMTLEHSGFQGGGEMESHKEAWSGYLYNLRAYLLQR